MTDFTQSWQWPQWVMITLILMTFLIKSSMHGKDVKQNGFYALADAAILIFILICGGFFS